MKRATILSVLLLFAICAAAQRQHLDGKSWWRHIEVLAADNMEGRDTGSPGLQRAEAYVVDQLQNSGLAPAGTNGYYQPIQFESREIVGTDSSAALIRNGKAEPLVLREDFFFAAPIDIAREVEAPLVFLGYGAKIPEKNLDDFAGLDLKGKIAVVIPGLPEGVSGPLAADYDLQRWKHFRDAGLIGWIVILRPGSRWSQSPVSKPTIHLVDDERTKGQQISLGFNPAHADRLFEGTGHTTAELFALARDRKPLPRFALPVSIRAKTRMMKKPLACANVIAKIEGSDPKLKNEYIVLSAHIDHLGMGQPVNGDRIYNGAIDNAAGVAALLDIAAELKKEGARPKRSLLFVFFTGEEKGHLGSKYFTAHPTVDPKSIVANVNVDPVQAIAPLKAVVMLGLNESDLGDAARRAAASQNIPIEPEATAHPNGFTCCSDHYSFIVSGIPAIAPKVGFPGELTAVLQKWRQVPYHTPSDDLQQPVNLEAAGKFEEIVLQLLLDVANNPRRPEWKSNSFFKRYAAK